ncbi:putative autocrine proliferation repressor protein A-like [Apostichopus japonicus]|uniref:Putative autocrine proliferation repressor protein A-like n=1 Tax=Stichopus japonicus TaxID=307972 RepID=A0A2G8KQK4_STIJA|nr:putative autocrine proliferation repressor protein A-like [Apostichopus japonicus]
MEPVRVGGWVALTLSGTRRDFRRLMAKEPGSSVQPVPQDVRFDNFEVNTLTPTTFEAVISIPAHRWACFFIELHFLAPGNEIMSTTTEVHIVPSTFPTKPCSAEECISHLV